MGLSGLPNFEELGAEGHHYDVESGTSHVTEDGYVDPRISTEFFLHHEGMHTFPPRVDSSHM